MSTSPALRPCRSLLALTLVSLGLPAAGAAQQSPPGMQASGPRIASAGPTFAVENPTFEAPADHVFRAVFEIDQSDADGTQMNPQLVTIARFLNLHARHGVPDARVHAAAVVHGGGWTALMTDEAYGARFEGRANPTRALVEELVANGVQLVLCGQTAGARGVHRDDLLPGVQLGLSAMTALNVFQAQGYQFNPW